MRIGEPDEPSAFGTFLRSVSGFEMMDVWAPIKNSKGGFDLCFSGGHTLSPKSESWKAYSRRFSFPECVGVPGRVFKSYKMEQLTGLPSLGEDVFLRRAGAVELGLSSLIALPVPASGNGEGNQVMAVCVLYSLEKTESLNDSEIAHITKNLAHLDLQVDRLL
jgi:hypothetical protein